MSVKGVKLWNSMDHMSFILTVESGNITLLNKNYTAKLLDNYKINNDYVY